MRVEQTQETNALRALLVEVRADVTAGKAINAKALEAIDGLTEMIDALEDAFRRMGRQIGVNAQHLQAGLATLRKALSILQRKIRGY